MANLTHVSRQGMRAAFFAGVVATALHTGDGEHLIVWERIIKRPPGRIVGTGMTQFAGIGGWRMTG